MATHDFMFELRDENNTLRESYNAGDDDHVKQYGSEEAAQTFTTDGSYYFRKIKLLLYRIGTPGTVSIGLYTTDADGHPDSFLASVGFSGDTVLGTDPAGTWVEKTFSQSSFTLLAAYTKYAIRISGGDNISNCVAWRVDTTNATYTKGAREHSTDNASTWTTYADAPTKPANPSPSDAASDITLDESSLSWDASTPVAADTYEIYFREQGNAWDLVGVAQAGVSYTLDFGTLDYEITYEWRIDATNTAGTTIGTVWSFGSIVFDPPLAGASGGGGGGGGGGGSGEESSPNGENNMITLRRLVAAANSKIWYEDV